jgi:hypothetical protein
MRLRNGQKLYKVKDVTGRWIKKVEYPNADWTESEQEAQIWKKLHALRAEFHSGCLRPEKLEVLLGGLPPEAVEIVEYEIEVKRTGRKHRITEIGRFYEKGKPDGQTDV